MYGPCSRTWKSSSPQRHDPDRRILRHPPPPSLILDRFASALALSSAVRNSSLPERASTFFTADLGQEVEKGVTGCPNCPMIHSNVNQVPLVAPILTWLRHSGCICNMTMMQIAASIVDEVVFLAKVHQGEISSTLVPRSTESPRHDSELADSVFWRVCYATPDGKMTFGFESLTWHFFHCLI